MEDVQSLARAVQSLPESPSWSEAQVHFRRAETHKPRSDFPPRWQSLSPVSRTDRSLFSTPGSKITPAASVMSPAQQSLQAADEAGGEEAVEEDLTMGFGAFHIPDTPSRLPAIPRSSLGSFQSQSTTPDHH